MLKSMRKSKNRYFLPHFGYPWGRPCTQKSGVAEYATQCCMTYNTKCRLLTHEHWCSPYCYIKCRHYRTTISAACLATLLLPLKLHYCSLPSHTPVAPQATTLAPLRLQFCGLAGHTSVAIQATTLAPLRLQFCGRAGHTTVAQQATFPLLLPNTLLHSLPSHLSLPSSTPSPTSHPHPLPFPSTLPCPDILSMSTMLVYVESWTGEGCGKGKGVRIRGRGGG